jgi:hypothetical protein
MPYFQTFLYVKKTLIITLLFKHSNRAKTYKETQTWNFHHHLILQRKPLLKKTNLKNLKPYGKIFTTIMIHSNLEYQ